MPEKQPSLKLNNVRSNTQVLVPFYILTYSSNYLVSRWGSWTFLEKPFSWNRKKILETTVPNFYKVTLVGGTQSLNHLPPPYSSVLQLLAAEAGVWSPFTISMTTVGLRSDRLTTPFPWVRFCWLSLGEALSCVWQADMSSPWPSVPGSFPPEFWLRKGWIVCLLEAQNTDSIGIYSSRSFERCRSYLLLSRGTIWMDQVDLTSTDPAETVLK